MMQKSIQITQASSERIMKMNSLFIFSSIQILLGDVAAGRNSIYESRKVMDPLDGNSPMDAYHRNYAGLLIRTGKLTEAIHLLRPSLTLNEQNGWQRTAAICDRMLANAYRREGNFAEAWIHLRKAREFGEKSSWQYCIGDTHVVGGYLHWAVGEVSDAEREARDGLRVAEQFGFGLLRIDLLNLRGEIELARDPAAAEATALEAERFAGDPACGYAWGLADALDLLGRARTARGFLSDARDPLERALALREKLTDPRADETRQSLSKV
jgi:tetratricopeptide (TPR) repeat protein